MMQSIIRCSFPFVLIRHGIIVGAAVLELQTLYVTPPVNEGIMCLHYLFNVYP